MFDLKWRFGKVKDQVKDAVDVLRDLRGPYQAGARELRAFLRKWYDSHGRGSWAGHSKWTKDNRNRRFGYYGASAGGGGKTLRWSGAMRRSIFQRGAKGHVERITAKSMVFGTEYTYQGKPLPLFHDLSQERPRFARTGRYLGVLPRRRIFPIDIMFQELSRTIHIQIQRAIGGFSPLGARRRR